MSEEMKKNQTPAEGGSTEGTGREHKGDRRRGSRGGRSRGRGGHHRGGRDNRENKSEVTQNLSEPVGNIPEKTAEKAQNAEASRSNSGGRNRSGRGRGDRRGHSRGRDNRRTAPETEVVETPIPAEEPVMAPAVPEEEIEISEALLESEPALVQAPENPVEVIGVRFKAAGKVYYFAPGELKLRKNSYVIVETARGTEFGEVALGNKIVDLSQVVPPLRPVLRAATEADIARNAENKQKEKEAFRICLEKITEHGLDMKLVDVEYTFDRNKLLFYFTSEGRVDFRELVKNLASVFRTRIELRQIGIRDEAKLMGGLGICGRPLCCSSFLSDFVQVSIKMAKEQNLSLNSSKISGVCGRLMCCLRYESDTYAAELRRSPAVDALVRTPDGTGVVTEVNPLAGTVKVRFPENTPPPKTFSRDEVKVIGRAGKGGRPDEYIEGEQA